MASASNIETKFTFPLGNKLPLISALTPVCVRDPKYPETTVNSLYFDTPSRFHLAEKVNSDYVKTKIRIRWYDTSDSVHASDKIQAFIEIKAKEGIVRTKKRIPIEVSRAVLAAPFQNPEFYSEFKLQLVANGYNAVGPVFPMIVIQYKRNRFIEPLSASRISVDTHISYTCINGRFFPPTYAKSLTFGVLEVKSHNGELPRTFFSCSHMLNRRDSFSKYEECWQMHADPRYRREFRWMPSER